MIKRVLYFNESHSALMSKTGWRVSKEHAPCGAQHSAGKYFSKPSYYCSQGEPGLMLIGSVCTDVPFPSWLALFPSSL